MALPHMTLRSFPVLVAAGLGGLDLAASQRRGFKDPLKAHGGLVIWLLGLCRAVEIWYCFLQLDS
jgi:hypothetical protein